MESSLPAPALPTCPLRTSGIFFLKLEENSENPFQSWKSIPMGLTTRGFCLSRKVITLSALLSALTTDNKAYSKDESAMNHMVQMEEERFAPDSLLPSSILLFICQPSPSSQNYPEQPSALLGSCRSLLLEWPAYSSGLRNHIYRCMQSHPRPHLPQQHDLLFS